MFKADKLPDAGATANQTGACASRLLVVAPSVRWLMQSARRASLPVVGIDFFADVDAVQAGEVVRVTQWSEVAVAAAALRPQATLMGGGFETQPRVVEALRRQGPCWNLAAAQCAALRDPAQWSAALRAVGLSVPDYLCVGDSLRASELANPRAKRWLIKRRDQAGGTGVQLLTAGDVSEWLARGPSQVKQEYLQEQIPGRPSSALFMLGSNRVSCLGFFRQLCGGREFGARGYQYCGGIGPLPTTAGERQQLEGLGRGLLALGARGVVGVDLIARGETLYPIEINPRLTASGELWERAEPEVSLLGLHAAEFVEGAGWPAELLNQANLSRGNQHWGWMERSGEPIFGKAIFGKAIVYWSGTRPLEISDDHSAWLLQAAREGGLADIPQAGSRIDPGAPVVTLFAAGGTESEVVEALVHETKLLRARLELD